MKFMPTFVLLVVVVTFSLNCQAQDAANFNDLYLAGQVQEDAGHYVEARAEYEKALVVEGVTPDQTGQALVGIGESFIGEKKLEDGIAALQRARALNGISNQTKIQATLLLGQTYLAYPWILDVDEAREAFVEILGLSEITPEQKIAAQKGLIKVLMGLRQVGKARSTMLLLAANPALTPAEKLATRISIGMTYMLEGRYPEARTELIKASGMESISDADEADIQLQIALSYYEAGDSGRAKPELEKVLTMPGANKTQEREDGWANYVPFREAKLRLLKMNPSNEEEKTLSVLFIGSSMTLRGYMPLVVEDLAASAPAGRPQIMTAMYTRGGVDIDVFWDAGEGQGTARDMIVAVPWDVVVLETFYTMSPEDLLKYGKLFSDLARKCNIAPVLYECHPESLAPYPEASWKFHKNVMELGKTLDTPVAPVALAEVKYLEAVPTAQREVFYADGVHPSENGVYIEACCIYSAITGCSPVGLSHPDSISDEDAKALQEAAWKAVQETNPNLEPIE